MKLLVNKKTLQSLLVLGLKILEIFRNFPLVSIVIEAAEQSRRQESFAPQKLFIQSFQNIKL
jgi:hypothetical protein